MDATTAAVIGDIAFVIVISGLLSAAARRFGQPTVIGQILTGVVLGPSLLGRLPGHLSSHLFPHQVLSYLTVLSQIAVAIFMFAVGYEIDMAAVRGRGRVVPLLATSALAVPFALAVTCVLLLRPEFSSLGETHLSRSFLLFMGVACSITALPVLSAIARERGLAGTRAGVTATAAAGIMDVLAWLVLAAALIGHGQPAPFPWLVTLALVGGFATAMLVVVPRLLSWWTRRSSFVLSNQVPAAFALAMGAAWVTTSLGLHPMFGGFLAGMAMRAGNRDPDEEVVRSIEHTAGLLLPLFFIVTGLSLDIGAMRKDAIVLLAVILIVAVVGKVWPAYAVSRLCGLQPLESATVAALVNTRGLTELVALNVGLAAGLIDQQLFTVLVLMALITTLLTGPALGFLSRRGSTFEPATGDQVDVTVTK